MLDACIQNFVLVSTLYRAGGGGGRENCKKKGCTILRGNREMTGKYEYCITVPRTFVQDCSYKNLGLFLISSKKAKSIQYNLWTFFVCTNGVKR